MAVCDDSDVSVLTPDGKRPDGADLSTYGYLPYVGPDERWRRQSAQNRLKR